MQAFWTWDVESDLRCCCWQLSCLIGKYAATVSLPKKLAQPVTIIIIGILYRSTIDRCGMGKCMSQDRASAGNLADELGRAFAFNNWHEDNTSTKGFDLCGTNYLVLSVVRALDKNIGLQSFDQF